MQGHRTYEMQTHIGTLRESILVSVAEPLIHHLHTFLLFYIQYIHILFTDKIIKITEQKYIIVIKIESLLKHT